METHVHIRAVPLIAGIAATVAVFGTMHLLALGIDNRWTRAYLGLGF
jgi:hypothetical protein